VWKEKPSNASHAAAREGMFMHIKFKYSSVLHTELVLKHMVQDLMTTMFCSTKKAKSFKPGNAYMVSLCTCLCCTNP